MRAADLDENLIIRIAQGDGLAFQDLYHQTAGAVYGFALSILKNRADAVLPLLIISIRKVMTLRYLNPNRFRVAI